MHKRTAPLFIVIAAVAALGIPQLAFADDADTADTPAVESTAAASGTESATPGMSQADADSGAAVDANDNGVADAENSGSELAGSVDAAGSGDASDAEDAEGEQGSSDADLSADGQGAESGAAGEVVTEGTQSPEVTTQSVPEAAETASEAETSAAAATVAAKTAANTAVPTLKAGWYNIKSKLGTSFSLFVKGLSTKSGATIQLKKTTNSVGAAFLLKKEGERYRIYVGIGSGKYVEIKGSKAGAAVRTTAKKGSSSLYSLEYDAKLGGYRIVGSSGLALTVKSGKATDGGKITGEKENADSLAQVFVLSSRPGLLATTVYSVKSVQKGSRSLSASGSSAKFHKYNKAATQKWYVAPVDGKTNVYTIESIATGKVLVGAKNKAVKLAKADASNSATWWVPTYKSGGIVWKNYKTGKPLSTAGKKCAEGSSAMNKKQKTAKASVFKMSGASVLESGIYELHSAANSGYVVSVEGSSKNAGASVQMQSSTGANAQKWVYNASSYTFSNANSGLMLQAGTDTKATITQAKANSSTAQQWTVKYAGGGKYQLVSRANSRLALTATASQGSSAATSTNTGATTQKWGIVATSITVTPTGFNLIKSIVNNGHGSLDADYIVIHETANPGATAKNHRDLWAGNGYYADYAVHYVVDWTKNCYYCVPEDRLCWQVGNGNSHVIGIELCHATTKANFNKVWDAGVQWATWQLKKHGWGIDRLLSHNECRKIWGGTDHTDPDGYFKTYGKTWSQFKAAVAKELAK